MPKSKVTSLRSRPPIERMLYIHNLLVDKRYPNCQKIAEELEVDPRTIARDISFMRDRLYLPIEYDPRRYGYYYTQEVKVFPTVNLTEKELFSLFVAQKAIAQYRGTNYEKPLRDAFEKLVSLLSKDISYKISNLDGAIAFRPFAVDEMDSRTFEKLNEAIIRHNIVTFEYRKLGENQKNKRVVRPYHLVCADNHWYLIGFDESRKAIRTFSLNRLSNLVVTRDVFQAPADFDLEKYLKGSLSIFKGNADYEVVIDFDKWAADLLEGRPVHPTQRITRLPQGIRMTLRLNNIEEVERWVMSWGIHATVVRPKVLVERITKNIETLARRYNIEYTQEQDVRPISEQFLPGLDKI